MTVISLRGRAARAAAACALSLAIAGAAVSSASGAGAKSRAVVKPYASATMGTFLTTMSGMPLYTHKTDRKDHSTCAGACLATWPALTVAKRVRPTGATGLGTFRRPNGRVQVTWRGWPLYTYSSDSADQPTGNGVNGFKLVVTRAPRAGTTTTVATTTTAPGATTTTMPYAPPTTVPSGY